MKKLLAMLLAAVMLLSVMGAVAETADQGTPLVVATSTLSEKFSPYFADTAYDQDVVNMTQASMMTTDRTGGIIYNGIEGETHAYNGTDYTYYGTGDLSVNYDEDADITTYTYKMREDLKFSDGEPVTIDDVIFNYYVFLDPAYNGSTTLNSYDILGLQAYRTQIPEASLDEVNAVIDAVKAAGFDYTVQEGDPFTQEAYDAYYNKINELWKTDLQGIVDYVYENYAADYAEATMGKTAEEIGASDGLKVALGMLLWGFGLPLMTAVITAPTAVTFDLAEACTPPSRTIAAAAQVQRATLTPTWPPPSPPPAPPLTRRTQPCPIRSSPTWTSTSPLACPTSRASRRGRLHRGSHHQGLRGPRCVQHPGHLRGPHALLWRQGQV